MTEISGSKLTEIGFQKYEIAGGLARETRDVLAGRRAILDPKIKPADESEIDHHVLTMIAVYRPDLPRGNAEMMIKAYRLGLKGMPEWAVKLAYERVMAGEDARADKRFAPTPPEFSDMVRTIFAPVKAEHLHLHRILTAKAYVEPTEEERARVAARLKQVVAGMAARAEQDERAEKEAQFRKREAIEEAARQAAATAAARQEPISPSSPEAERSSSPETHSESE